MRLRRNHESTYRRLAENHERYRRRQTTDRPMAIPTHWLASHETAKMISKLDLLNQFIFIKLPKARRISPTIPEIAPANHARNTLFVHEA